MKRLFFILYISFLKFIGYNKILYTSKSLIISRSEKGFILRPYNISYMKLPLLNKYKVIYHNTILNKVYYEMITSTISMAVLDDNYIMLNRRPNEIMLNAIKNSLTIDSILVDFIEVKSGRNKEKDVLFEYVTRSGYARDYKDNLIQMINGSGYVVDTSINQKPYIELVGMTSHTLYNLSKELIANKYMKEQETFITPYIENYKYFIRFINDIYELNRLKGECYDDVNGRSKKWGK